MKELLGFLLIFDWQILRWHTSDNIW